MSGLFDDPLDVTCDHCGTATRHPVAELLEFSAKCPACQADLTARGEAMHQHLDRMDVWAIVYEAIFEIEDELRTELPESILEGFDVETISPSTFVSRVEPVVREILKRRSTPDVRFDLRPNQGEEDSAGNVPWIETLNPDRFAIRVAQYREAAASNRGEAGETPRQDRDEPPGCEKYFYR